MELSKKANTIYRSNENKNLNFHSEKLNLTKREIDVAGHILQGFTSKESGKLLGISPRSVEAHIESMKNKFACNKKIELALILRACEALLPGK